MVNVMIGLRNLCLQIVGFIIFLIFSKVIPRNNNKIVVVGRYGEFIDSGKYIFLYLLQRGYDVKFIGYKEHVSNIEIPNIITYDRTLKGLWKLKKTLLSAGILIVDDPTWVRFGIGPLMIGSKKIFIEHGFGPKWYKPQSGLINKLKEYIRCDKLVKYKARVYLSPITAAIKAIAYNKWDEVILPIGYPRNDVIINQKKFLPYLTKDKSWEWYVKIKNVKSSGKKVVLYVPTYRKNKKRSKKVINSLIKQLKMLDPKDYSIIIKFHPSDYKLFNETKYLMKLKLSKFLIFIPPDVDIYPMLSLVDIIITDYSSIYIDAITTNNVTVLFYIPDLETFRSEVGLLPCYEEIMPGPKLMTPQEVIKTIKNLNNAKTAKHRLYKIFLPKQPGKSCEQLESMIQQI